MFESTSRYYSVGDASLASESEKGDEGQQAAIAYKKRRFLPDWSKMALLQEISVSEGDRLDRIAAQVAGDPEQFWRICDANSAMHPLELTGEPGSKIRIARPWS
jgi:hypothetical protein